MIIEKEPKEDLPPGQHKNHNLDVTVVTMTEDEAVDLIIGLTKFLYKDQNRIAGGCPDFREGIWHQRRIVFVPVPEQKYLEHLDGLRKTADRESETTIKTEPFEFPPPQEMTDEAARGILGESAISRREFEELTQPMESDPLDADR